MSVLLFLLCFLSVGVQAVPVSSLLHQEDFPARTLASQGAGVLRQGHQRPIFPTFVERLDKFSLQLFSIFRLKSFASQWAGQSTRIAAAVALSFMMVLLIFVSAMQLQRAVIVRAFEAAEQQEPLLYRGEAIKAA